ncbi:hypothetical protein MNBD_GAMMA08-3110 [hydrothermal vent metagenome]|uniref:Uncharacterized protein n=1 Tax=hydrothermal vent metagenome TaxID=652676 RepID=A0A3B0XB92_9ZZZZ
MATLLNFNWFMIGLDTIMIIYTLWVLSLKNNNKFHYGIGLGLFIWLTVLHFGLSTKSLFPEDISGIFFLIIIFIAVGLVGALLLFTPPIRRIVLGLDQQQLLLIQGIRVFFGASFLTQASLGAMPLLFGVIDGWTHVAAGFFGLIAAYSVASGINAARRVWFANIFGLLDILIVASSLSLLILDDITPHGSMMYAVFLPAPLWLWAHLISIYKLVQSNKVGSPC